MTDELIDNSLTTKELAQAMGRVGDALEPFREPLADEITKAEPSNDKFLYGFEALKGHLLARHAGELTPMYAALAAGPDGPIGKIVTDSLKGMIRVFSGVEPNFKAPDYAAYIGGMPDFVLAQKALVSTHPDELESLWDRLIGETIFHINRVSTSFDEAMRHCIDSVLRDDLSDREKEAIPVVTDIPAVAGALSMLHGTWRASLAFKLNKALKETWISKLILAEHATINNIRNAFCNLSSFFNDNPTNTDDTKIEMLRDIKTDSKNIENPFDYMNVGYALYIKDYLEKEVIGLPSENLSIRPGDPVLVKRAIRRIMESIATTYEAADPVARANATVQVEYDQGTNAISFVGHGGVALLSGLAEGTSARARLGSIADQMTGGGRLAFSQDRINLILPAFKGPFSPAISGALWSAPPIPRTALW